MYPFLNIGDAKSTFTRCNWPLSSYYLIREGAERRLAAFSIVWAICSADMDFRLTRLFINLLLLSSSLSTKRDNMVMLTLAVLGYFKQLAQDTARKSASNPANRTLLVYPSCDLSRSYARVRQVSLSLIRIQESKLFGRISAVFSLRIE